MLKKLLVCTALLASSVAFAAGDECKKDEDCKDGKVCVLAVTPHVCKAPQPAGSPCIRDKVCASGKCDMPEGKKAGTCK